MLVVVELSVCSGGGGFFALGRYFGSSIPSCEFRASVNGPRYNAMSAFVSGVARTMDRNLHTVSVGCAPTPTQYFALSTSSLISLCSLPDSSYESFFGMGSYVPMTSSGFEFRAVLDKAKAVSLGALFWLRRAAEGCRMGVLALHVRRQCCRMGSLSARTGRA